MPAPLVFWFDFASPYAYFALDKLDEIAAAHGRSVSWRPILVWALLKAQGAPAPMGVPAKRDYFLADMARSAAFYGVNYSTPSRFPLSAHRAARLFHALGDGTQARAVGRDVFAALFQHDADIADAETLVEIAGRHGVARADALSAMEGETGRARLAEANEQAVAAGVCGSPWIVVDGEAFFGADRLPQIAWRLSGAAV